MVNNARHAGAFFSASRRRRGLALLVVSAALLPAPAQQAAAQDATAAVPPAATTVRPQSRANVRVYEAWATLGPVYGWHDTPLAVDVGVALATCPDGNTEIRALDVGGWQYHVASSCTAGNERGSIRVDAGSLKTTPPPATPAAQPTTIRCNPATWRCAPAP